MNLRSTIQKNIEDALETLTGKGYDPNQPRAEDGKWTASGSGGGKQSAKKKDVVGSLIRPEYREQYKNAKKRAETFFHALPDGELAEYSKFDNRRPNRSTMHKLEDYLEDRDSLMGNVMNQWQDDPAYPLVMEFKAAADVVEGRLDHVTIPEGDYANRLDDHRPSAEMVDAYIELRAFNQAYMEKIGFRGEVLMRSVGGNTGNKLGKLIEDKAKKGGDFTITIDEHPLSGYTRNPEILSDFGSTYINVPVSRPEVVIHPDLMGKMIGNHDIEMEFIVRSGKREVPKVFLQTREFQGRHGLGYTRKQAVEGIPVKPITAGNKKYEELFAPEADYKYKRRYKGPEGEWRYEY